MIYRFRARGEGVMPNDHFCPRVGRGGHDSRLSKIPQTPMNSTRLSRNATAFDLRIESLPLESPHLDGSGKIDPARQSSAQELALYLPRATATAGPGPEAPWSPSDVSVFVTDVRRAVDQQSCGTEAQ